MTRLVPHRLANGFAKSVLKSAMHAGCVAWVGVAHSGARPASVHTSWNGSTAATTIIVDERRQRVWSLNSDSDTVAVIDATTFVRLAESKVGDNPRTLAMGPDGTVWVVNQDDATISLLDGDTALERTRVALPYASRPYGIAFSPSGDLAYVTLQATGRLVRLNALDATPVGDAIDVGPTPRGVAVSADGSRVLVTRYISPTEHGVVTAVDAESGTVARRFELAFDLGPDSPIGGRGVPNLLAAVVIAPDGRRAWIASKKDNTARGLHRSGEALTFETTTRTIVSQLDLTANREVLAARRDLDDRAMAVAVAFDPQGRYAFVALQGSNAVDVLDAASGERVTSIPQTGLAPQGLVLDERGRLFVQNFLSRDVAVYDALRVARGAAVPLLARVATVEREPLPADVLLGKQIFYNAADPRMSRDGYVSCAGCHVEGGSDGRVWDYSGRGLHGGGLRNTTALVGRAGLRHGPIHWRADMDEIQDFEMLLRTTLQGKGFVADSVYNAKSASWVFGPSNAGLSPELDALASYLATFSKVNPSPYRDQSGVMTNAALAGEVIFHGAETGCAVCHSGAAFTDSSLQRPRASPSPDSPALPFTMHDVGTLTEAAGDFRPNTLRALDTPTLKGVWEAPPYLHDGSAATLLDVITVRNAEDRHGQTSQLSPTEKAQLVAYLQQLDDTAVPTSVGVAPLDARQQGVLAFELEVGDLGGVRLESLMMRLDASTPGSMSNASFPSVAVSIHADTSGDGRFDPVDSLLAEATLVARNDATVQIPGGLLIEAGGKASLFVVMADGAWRPDALDWGADEVEVVLTGIGACGLTAKERSSVSGIPQSLAVRGETLL